MSPRKAASRAYELALQTPWAITEAALNNILAIAQRKNATREAVEAQLGRPLENTSEVTIRDGIAQIPVRGALFRYANLFTWVSGCSSYEELATDFSAALESPDVRAIVLAIDSPGGDVNGCQELAQLIYAARGRKRIIAHVSGEGCSGGYWISSAADEVVVGKTAVIGSIGCVYTTYVTKDAEKMAGIRRVKIISSQSPRKQPDPDSDQGRADIQQTIDDLAQVFIESVATNRGVTAEDVLANYGQGAVFVGERAVEAGLADRVATYEELHQLIVADLAGARPAQMVAAYQAHKTGADMKTQSTGKTRAEGGESDTPPDEKDKKDEAGDEQEESKEKGKEKGKSEGEDCPEEQKPEAIAAKERARILSIQAYAMPGREALIKSCVEDPKCTPEMAAAQILAAENQARGKGLAALKADATQTPAPGPLAPSNAGDSPAARGQALAASYLALTGRAPVTRAN